MKYKLNSQLFARKPSDYDEIFISDKQEYAMVMSNVRTYATKQDKNDIIFGKVIGDYYYTFRYVEEDRDYLIVGKELARNIHE